MPRTWSPALVVLVTALVAATTLRSLGTPAWADAGPELAHRCRTFLHPLDGSALIDTHDQTSEIGQWVAAQRADGWRVEGIDFEVASKATGFPQGYAAVCLVR